MTEPYKYEESGLDNVFIYNMPAVTDANGEKTFYIPKINLLHKAIAHGIINKSGLINSKEIRFLRTEMGYTQKQFSELLGKEEQACGRWERGETVPDRTTDILLRISVAEYLHLNTSLEDINIRTSQSSADTAIKIDAQNNLYSLIA